MTAEPWCPEPSPEPESADDPDPDRREYRGDWYPEWGGPTEDALIAGVQRAHDLMEAALANAR